MYVPPLDASLVLATAGARTANTNHDALNLGRGYAPGGLGQRVGAAVDVTALTAAAHTYTFKLQQSADGLTGWTDIGAGVAATAAGRIVVKGLVTTENVRLVLAVTGSTPSINYSALLGIDP